ncbi:D-sedoheptulose 7-phosphate isomerase [Paenibacillus campi]|uniref:D-sedoheptulose-7-phosphate isomerase n=1 Tax=Paenibacillus campi TaxID=3106031 RepID=UPI002AFEF6DD|nr:D-sedoheptulose 7-phosphate isomerase [Paenibacillus sp. SGZ-1014]
MKQFIKQQINDSFAVKQQIFKDEQLVNLIEEVSAKTIAAYQGGYKTLFAGNGGSAADAQHLAGEFVSRFYFDRPGLASLALTTDTSILTAIGNDYGYEQLFARQIQANGVKGDIFFGISTSGNSPNIVRALEVARAQGITTVGLTGSKIGEMDALCDYCIKVPSAETPRIQEAHILIGHIVCAIVEEAIFGKEFKR